MEQCQIKEVHVKIMRGLLDLIIFEMLEKEPMHGYQIIVRIRKGFGVYFGPSTIYPLLNLLEEKGYIKSTWDLNNDRPRKVYALTSEGRKLVSYTENSLIQIVSKMQMQPEVIARLN